MQRFSISTFRVEILRHQFNGKLFFRGISPGLGKMHGFHCMRSGVMCILSILIYFKLEHTHKTGMAPSFIIHSLLSRQLDQFFSLTFLPSPSFLRIYDAHSSHLVPFQFQPNLFFCCTANCMRMQTHRRITLG